MLAYVCAHQLRQMQNILLHRLPVFSRVKCSNSIQLSRLCVTNPTHMIVLYRLGYGVTYSR